MKDFLKTVFASALGYLVASFFITVFSLLFVISLVVGALMFNKSSDKEDMSADFVREKSVLYLNVEGSLVERRSPRDVMREILVDDMPKELGLFEAEQVLNKAASDDNIKGVYMRLRSVNSGWAKVEALRKMLLRFRESGKFVYAYSESYNEKLYYLATAADEIWMYPKGDFEWDGIYAQPAFFKKTFGKLDIEPTLIRAGRFKAAGEMFTHEKMSQENRQQLTELTTEIWKQVLSKITESRKDLTVEALNQWAQNLEISTAQEAYNHKLVTELLPVEEIEKKLMAATDLKEKEPRLVSWSSYYSLMEKKGVFKGAGKNKVAVILAEGEIQSGHGKNAGTIYSDDLSVLIRKINRDKDVKAVVLRVDSPGGSALASDVIWRSLEYLKKNKKILVSSFSDTAASGGYYISAGSHYIFAEPTTVTGSIGVFGVLFNTEKFFDDKLGVTFDRVKTHSSSDISTGRALTPFEYQKIQGDVNVVYKTFLNVVRQGRSVLEPEGAVEEVAEGRVWVGTKAKEIGLIDEVGSLNDAVKKAVELARLKDYKVVFYPEEEHWFDRLFSSFTGMMELPHWVRAFIPGQTHQPVEKIYTEMPQIIEL